MKKLKENLRVIRNKHFPPKLEFGCEIKSCGNVWKITDGRWEKVSKEKEKYLIKNFGYGKNWYNKIGTSHYEPFTEVLGKSVSLEEVLRLLQKKYDDAEIHGDGLIYIFNDCENCASYELVVDNYDLTRSPEEQDDETLKKIINLIK